MADIIKLLPDSVANQIAAGEVIQRPASAVKELLENAVDAEATEIRLIINEAGKSLIQVIDNGKGMSEKELLECCEPFYTTKHGSTGLGLSLSKKIIEIYGGHLHITSQVGKGTSVSILVWSTH